jgi:hypothetical protein
VCFVDAVRLGTWGPSRGQCLVMAVLGGVSSLGKMVYRVLVLHKRWVASFDIGRKLCLAPAVAGDVDTLHADFLSEASSW